MEGVLLTVKVMVSKRVFHLGVSRTPSQGCDCLTTVGSRDAAPKSPFAADWCTSYRRFGDNHEEREWIDGFPEPAQFAGAGGWGGRHLAALGSTGQANAQTQPAGGSGAARVRDTFDFGWKFFKGDAPGAQQPNFADASWRDVDLPHDWSIEGPFSDAAGSARRSLPTGIGWYRKRFSIPESYRDRKVVIEFDGVYQLSEVWINGQYLGKRPYGYISFCYDLTPHLKFGGDNVIAVKVDNSHQPNCRWYSGSGIYRHTWLLVTNQVHVAYWGTFVTTPQVDVESSIVQIKTKVQNEGRSDAECTLATSILDRDGKRSRARR